MPFTWQININKNTGGTPAYRYDPPQLNNVAIGDQIMWTNNDDKPHWPALADNQTYFMPNQIAPHSPSDCFVPGVNGLLTYVDSLDAAGPTGVIVVV
jgi:plastocyanin